MEAFRKKENMAKLIAATFPTKLTNSLRQLGRLDPQDRLILDVEGEHKNIKDQKTVMGKSFSVVNLGYLGEFMLVDYTLLSLAQGKSLLRQAEKAEKLLEEGV